MSRIIKISEDSEKVVLRALVTPFGSPERRDFSGEFFHAKTYFGDDIGVREKIAFYEHNINSKVNPHQPPSPKAILGKAVFSHTDEHGRWYDFEVKRRNEFFPYVMDLFTRGWLGASSQAFYGTKVMNAKVVGQIDVWVDAEPSLTPTPDNPATIFDETQIAEIQASMKTFAPRLYKAAYEVSAVAAVQPDLLISTPAIETPVVAVETASASFNDSIVDILKDVSVETVAATDTIVAAGAEFPELEALRAELAAEKAANIELRALVVESVGIVKTLGATLTELRGEVDDVKKSMTTTATFVKSRMTDIVAKSRTYSDMERAALGLDAQSKTADTTTLLTLPLETGFRKAFNGKGPGSKTS